MSSFMARLKALFTSADVALKADVVALEARIKALEASLRGEVSTVKAKLTKKGAK